MPRAPTNHSSGPRDLAILNADRDILPGPRLLHELIAITPEQELILDFLAADGSRIQLTYREFSNLTDILSNDLRARQRNNQSRGSIIPILIPQCPELYIAWVAVLKAGAAFCPVAQDVPVERLKFMLQDVDASLVLTIPKTSKFAASVAKDITCLNISLEDLRQRSRSCKDDEADADQYIQADSHGPAYVMYTSGSTGLPKGVMVSHFSVSQSLLAHDEHIPHFKRFLQFASPTFDVSIFEVFFPFFRGATLVGCERERMLSDLPATIQSLDADAAELTPTVAGTLLQTRQAAPCLKTLLTIGEMLTSKVVSEFGGDSERPSILYAMYGPTEAAIHCTLACKLASVASPRSIGRPLRTVTTYVLSETDRNVVASIGEPGELAVAGQLAAGYLNRPEQNKDAFVDLPGYGPVYKTGDRAICRQDGTLEILGRISSGQVKIRGQRVELGEIEEVASNTNGVQLAIALVIDDALVLCCAAQASVEAKDVSATCKAWLPPYMRPTKVILKEDLPQLPSGKVDRKTLEREYRDYVQESLPMQSFQDPIEADIAEVLRQEIAREVSRSTSFWSLGLDSLQSIKIASRLREKYRQLSAAMVAEAENIADLAANLKLQESRAICDDADPYKTSDEWETLQKAMLNDSQVSKLGQDWERFQPCSPMQLAMLVETATDETLNFNQIWLSLSSNKAFEDIFWALQKVAQRNEILRSGFVSTGDGKMPFAQILWKDLQVNELSLLHPLQLVQSDSDDGQILVRIHHALYDGWSWDLVIEDLNAVLNSKPLPKRPQFSQLISYQHQQALASEDLTYWRDLLQDIVPLEFPILSTSTSHSRRKDSITIPISVPYQHLSITAKKLHCSREALFEAAWAFLLSCYIDNPDVIIGVVSAGRHLPILGIESIIGPCLSTFPLRLQLESLRTVEDAVNLVQKQRLRTQASGALALRDIYRAANVYSGTKLFDTLCLWQQGYEHSQSGERYVRTTKTQDKLDYTFVLEFEPFDEAVSLQMTFDVDRIPRTHAEILAAQLDKIVSQMVQNPDTELKHLWDGCELELMSVVNAEYNKFDSCFDLTTTIRDVAKTDPQRRAVEYVRRYDADSGVVEKDTLTYHELLIQAEGLGSVLRTTYGIQSDDIVCVIAHRSVHLYVAILGIVISGAGYMCIDPQTPPERLRQILKLSKSCLVLLGDGAGAISTKEHQSAMIHELLKPTEQSKQAAEVLEVTNDHLAYAIFTSGSTGIPKGVLLTRKNLLSNLNELSHIYPSEPGKDRLLQSCSPAFDVSVFEIFWTWHMGMTLCTAPNDILFKDFSQFIDSLNVTHLSMTPSVAALVHPDAVPQIKMLVTAGEPMNSKVFGDWAGRGLYQGYGPSETTNICNVRPEVSRSDAANNVGPALSNTSVFICQRQKLNSDSSVQNATNKHPMDFQLVPKGAVGEVWIGGEQVARGYLDPELTANSFFEHPTFGRLYRSGDIGRLLADGTLNILGREDDQVKLRGQRIELGDINSSLLRSNEVRDAVSMVIPRESGNSSLVSFWTSRSSIQAGDDVKSIRHLFKQLASILPTYMIPDVLIHLEEIPLTRQGKVDRRLLTRVYFDTDPEHLQMISRDSGGHVDMTEFSEQESHIANAVSAALNVPLSSIRRNTSFYGLGMDSISVIKVARDLRTHFPDVEISTLLRNASISQLVALLVSEQRHLVIAPANKPPKDMFDMATRSMIVEAYAKERLGVEKILPCTPLQEIMAIGSLTPASKAYQNSLLFHVRGDLSKLHYAWTQAMSRQQILRTGFIFLDSAENPVAQVVLQHFSLPWFVDGGPSNITHHPQPLRFPPWSLQLQRRESGDHELILKIHHCLYDAEAMSILLSEVQAIYNGHSLQRPIAFDTYLEYMATYIPDASDEFWHRLLKNSTVCRLGDHVTSLYKSEDPESAVTSRSASLTVRELHEFARHLSSTPLSLFQACLTRLLSYLLGTRDVLFGSVLSGRNLPIKNINRVVAPCFNTLPIRVNLRRDATNSDLVQSLHDTNLGVMPFQPSSLRRIQRQNSTNAGALFDTLLLLQHGETKLDEHIWSLVEETGDMSFPFILEIIVGVDTDVICLKLHSEVANEQFLDQLLAGFDCLLSHTAKYPQSRAHDFSVVVDSLPSTKSIGTAASDSPRKSVSMEVNGVHATQEQLSDLETLVVNIMRELKPELPASIHKNTTIFHLGFDSINAVQIAASLRRQGYTVSSADIMEAASIGLIADVCGTNSGRHTQSLTFDLEAFDQKYHKGLSQEYHLDESSIGTVRPCTPTQAGILSQCLRSRKRMYYNSMCYMLDKDIDVSRLKIAWTEAQRIHEMLRTGFVETDDPRIPFAMVTYHHEAIQLPWTDARSVVNPSDREHMPDQSDLTKLQWAIHLTSHNGNTALNISMLHALYDARSLEIILQSVAALYMNQRPREPVAISPVVSKILAMSRNEESQSFWKQMAVDLSPTRFPDMRIHFTDDESVCTISSHCSLSCTVFETACADIGSSIQTVSLAAWSRILSAYTAQDRVAFGVILSGRDFEQEKENDVAFPCVNTVPFAIKATQEPWDLLESISRRSAAMLRYQQTPMNSIKRWIGVEEELFDTVLVVQKYSSTCCTASPWKLFSEETLTEYAVSLEIIPTDTDVNLQLTFRQNILPTKQARIILDEFDGIVRGILASASEKQTIPPQSLLSVVPPLDQRIATDVEFLHEFVEATASEKPSNVALEFIISIKDSICQKQSWTYSQLDGRGNQIAHLLRNHGASIGDLVAVCFDKCPEAYFAILGIQKAGCGYLAIDPGAPRQRKDFILRDSNCKISLTMNNLSGLDALEDIKVLSLESEDWQSLPLEKPVLSRHLSMQDTCYCLYTSGTTGTPKGCLISHDSAVQAMLAFQRIFRGRWSDNSRWLQFASFHFDVSVLEQYWSWGVGICVTSAPRDLLFEDLPGTINSLNITHLDLTPSLARLLTPEDVPSLCKGVFIVGGEQVTRDILEIWGDVGCLYNFYGPSEVTIGCTVHQNVPINAKPTNIGQQWDNVGSFVLEPNSQRPVLRGAVGELCLSGPLVGKGYLNRPELTAEKFVVLNDFKTRVYRTGDLVRILHDNSFEFLGRIDDQVKLRGQRLEIGEINHVAMNADTSIKDVVTMVLKHPIQQREQLVTFFSTGQRHSQNSKPEVQWTEQAETLANKIQEHCSDKLPGYMVPNGFLAVDFIPLSVNNKVDSKALKAMYEANLSQGRPSPTTGVEAVAPESSALLGEAVKILSNFLRVSESMIKPTSRLFELGLDSVSAIGLSRSLKRKGYQNAHVANILRHQTVSDLALAIHEKASVEQSEVVSVVQKRIEAFSQTHLRRICEALRIRDDEIESIAPCTPLQEGMISRVVRNELEDNTYLTCFRFQLNSKVDIERLRQAWLSACRSVSILRTCFVSTTDGYAQVVVRTCPNMKILYHDRKANSGANASVTPISQDWDSFGATPPWKVDLVDLARTQQMVLQIFHGLYDGISLPLLLNYVTSLYHGSKENPKNFYESLASGPLCHMLDAEKFWRSRLSNFEPLRLHQRHSANESSSKLVHIDAHVSLGIIQQLSQKYNVTSSALFQASWLYTLHKTFKSPPSMGVVLSGRSTVNGTFEDVIGPMFNTVPFAVSTLSEGSTLGDLVRACHNLNAEVMQYQSTPLRRIPHYLREDPRFSLFDNLFVFQAPRQTQDEGKLWIELTEDNRPDYPLNVEVTQRETIFNISIVAKPEYLNEIETQEILNSFIETVQSLESVNHVLPYVFCQPKQRDALSTATRSKELADPQRTGGDENMNRTQQLIRHQLAEMASVEEEMIRLERPTIFELGLDSIEAMKLATRLRNTGLKIAVSAIMRFPTVAGIAEHLQDGTQDPFSGSSNPSAGSLDSQKDRYRRILDLQGVNLRNVQTSLPVTPLQEGLLVESSKYLNMMALKVRADVDINRLVETWINVSRQQPILRTRFALDESPVDNATFFQFVLEEHVNVEIVQNQDLWRIIQNLRNDATSRAISDQRTNVRIVIDEDKVPFIVIALPHALYDAWSLHLLHQEILNSYRSRQTMPTKIVAIERHLERVLESSKSPESHSFWQKRASGTRSTLIRHSINSRDQANPSLLLQRVSKISQGDTLEFCKKQGITLQSLGLACCTIALAYYTSQLDVCFGLVLSGRTTDDSARLMFPTFNTVLFRQTIEESDTKTQFMKRVHDTAVQILEHQHFPLRKTLQYARQQGAGGEVFDTLFTFQKLPDAVDATEQLYDEIEGTDISINPPYPVNIEIEGQGQGITWTVAFQKHVANKIAADNILELLDKILSTLMLRPDLAMLERNAEGVSICGLPKIKDVFKLHNGNPAPVETHDAKNDGNEVTWSPIETTLRVVLAKVSNTDLKLITKSTGIFHLGLDSVSAIKLSSVFRKEGIKLPVSEIVKAQTIEAMAATVQRATNGGTRPSDMPSDIRTSDEELHAVRSSVGIPSIDIEEIIPCTAGQIFMLDMWNASQGRLFYPTFWLEVSEVMPETVLDAFQVLTDRMPILRTIFGNYNHDGHVRTWQIVVRKEVRRNYSFPWTLDVKKHGGGSLLTLRIHHALYDAVSFQLMATELERLCRNQNLQVRIRDSLSDFVIKTITGRERARKFWSGYLDIVSRPPLVGRGTFDSSRTERFNPRVLQVAQLTDRLKHHGVSLQALFFAAYARIYTRICVGSEEDKIKTNAPSDVIVGVYLANRSLDVEVIANLVAPTFNIVPLRVQFDAGTTTVEIAKQVQNDLANITSMENSGVSMREISEWTGTRVDTYVNFLSLPGEDDDEEPGDVDSNAQGVNRQVRVTHANVDSGGRDSLPELGSPSPFVDGDGDGPASREVVNWCLPAIDIEAKATDGYLGIGVFAPNDMLSIDQVEGIVDEMARLMLEIE
ncbi:NRPS protein [Exophiala oligosperma]